MSWQVEETKKFIFGRCAETFLHIITISGQGSNLTRCFQRRSEVFISQVKKFSMDLTVLYLLFPSLCKS